VGAADVWLDTAVTAPPGSRFEPGPTWLRVPGQPGSIEKGAIEQRGFELTIVTPPSTSTRVRTEMSVTSRPTGR
jgi:hypothetical protein